MTVADTLIYLSSLVIFRGIMKDPVMSAFYSMLDSRNDTVHKRVGLYSEFMSRLLDKGDNLSEYLLSRLLCDENRYVVLLGAGLPVPTGMKRALEAELEYLQSVGQITPEQVAGEIGCTVPPARWEVSPIDFKARYFERLVHIKDIGYGIFAEYNMFLLRNGELVPVLHPDPISIKGLTGYGREREAVTANTLALLDGKAASNILLYGDSGTGKSTCVKAIVNEFSGRGLRLIELRKDQLDQIPMLIDRLNGNPLKFILFIDDLSFSQNSDNFTALKAVLEGSVSTKASNMAVYATSNRRHLVRETFSERDGDDVHLRDTLEESGSLSDRFGLVVTFLRPDKELYLDIAKQYLGHYGIGFTDEMREKAEAFAIRRGGRSARAAKQFAELTAALN